MGFDYEKHKGEHGGHEWVAFSDLYLCLSTVFLFLFVVASLRAGMSSIQAELKVQELANAAAAIRDTRVAMDAKAEQYLQEAASKSEEEMYRQLMDKLYLLKDEANEEKSALQKQVLEVEKKEQALNQYQQMVKDVINSKLADKAKIDRRDDVIEVKDQKLVAKSEEVQKLERDVNQKRRALEQGQRQMAEMTNKLDERMQELQRAYENNEITKRNFEAQTARIQEETANKISQLASQNTQISQQLQAVNRELTDKEKKMAAAQAAIAQKEAEKERLQAELAGASEKAAQQVAALREQAQRDAERARGEFEAELARQKLSAAERDAKEAEFREKAKARERELGEKMAALQGQMKATQGELEKAKELANARKKLADQIKQNFSRAGIKADVDPGTGDVVLDFGDQYFDTGRADLKPKMRAQLEKTMPVYSASLFSDPKVAQKIKGIEIVGFASPTYKGKYIDPNSLNPEDRKAVEFNLDLSYQRAKAIFSHVFDENKMQFKHQKDLVPLVKVTGRSFLAEAKTKRTIAGGTSEKEFCEVYDCKKAQRVIIKFNLGE